MSESLSEGLRELRFGMRMSYVEQMDSLDVLRRLVSPLAGLRGLRRVNESLRRRHSRSDTVRVISDFDGDLRFSCRLDSHISSTIYWSGSYSSSQLRLLDRMLRADMTFMDVGANEGEQTVFAAKRLSSGRVIAFEPNPKVFAMLERNVALNGFANTTLVPSGLGERSGELTLFGGDLRAADGAFNLGLSSLHQRDGVTMPVGTVKVETLDEYCEREGLARLDVVKIDVEGSELAVLRGAVRAFERFRPAIIVEVNERTSRAAGYAPTEILQLVNQLGYAVENICEDGTTRPLARWSHAARDVLCIPRGGRS